MTAEFTVVTAESLQSKRQTRYRINGGLPSWRTEPVRFEGRPFSYKLPAASEKPLDLWDPEDLGEEKNLFWLCSFFFLLHNQRLGQNNESTFGQISSFFNI